MKINLIAVLLTGTFISGLIVGQDDPPTGEPATGIQQRAIIVARPEGGGDGPQEIEIQSFEFSTDGPGALGDHSMFSFSTAPGAMVRLGTPSGNSGMMNLLQNKSIREEIELVDDQYKKMQDFYKSRQASIMKEVQALIKPAAGGGKKSNESVQLRGKKIKEMIDKQQKEAEDKLKDLLLPHQLKRLEQVSHQVRMKNSGTLNSLTRGKLKEELDLSDDDVKNLKDKSKSIQKKLEEDIAKLRAKAKKDLLKELSPKQQRKLEEILGDKFEYKPTDWQSRIKEIQERVKKRTEKK